MNARTEGRFTRKEFLQALGILTGAGAFACGGGIHDHFSLPSDTVTVYKLSSRRRHACNACISHARNKLFATWSAANANRAHDGCNCIVRTFVLSREDYEDRFPPGILIYDPRL